MINLERQPQAYTLEFDTPRNPDIKDNLKSLLGERFNVLISTTRYTLRNGEIYKEGGAEPFLNSVKRGRDYRRSYPDPIDYRREDAEVIGFEKIQDELADPNVQIGTMMISISPPGPENSVYQMNFYDVFTKTNWGIEARRYSSALTYQEYAEFLLEMGFEGLGETADDTFFLSNPIKIDKFKTAEDLHNYLYREHEHISVQELERVWKDSEALASIYLKAVAMGNLEFKKSAMNAFLNGADMSHFHKEVEVFKASDSTEKFYALAMKPVREVKTGCGSSCGVSVANSPQSVSEFGTKTRNYKFDKEGPCRTCGSDKKQVGPVGICEKCNDKIDSGELVI